MPPHCVLFLKFKEYTKNSIEYTKLFPKTYSINNNNDEKKESSTEGPDWGSFG